MADGFSIESGGGLSTIEHTTAEMAEAANSHNISMSSGATGRRTVRLVYCSDGVLEECDEDVEEQKRLEKEAAEKELEERRKMDLEAVSSIYYTVDFYYHKYIIRSELK